MWFRLFSKFSFDTNEIGRWYKLSKLRVQSRRFLIYLLFGCCFYFFSSSLVPVPQNEELLYYQKAQDKPKSEAMGLDTGEDGPIFSGSIDKNKKENTLILEDKGHLDTIEGEDVDKELDTFFKELAREKREGITVGKGFRLFNKSKKDDLVNGAKIHIVQRSESLWSIAKKYKVPPKEVLEANPNLERGPLYVGDSLVIPSIVEAGENKLPKKGYDFYIVESGDTLYGISRKYNTTSEKLLEINHLNKQAKLIQGQRLRVKVSSATPKRDSGVHQDNKKKGLSRKEIKEDESEVTEKEENSNQEKADQEGLYMKRDLDPDKKETSDKFFQWPVHGRITSGYGKRHDPKLRRRIAFHKGIDIANVVGTPFQASQSGVVIRSKRVGAYGNCIFILHKDNLITVYAHNQKNNVVKGEIVKQGQLIGTVGRTGKVTGPHLHFEVRRLKIPMNPVKFLSYRRPSFTLSRK